MIYFGFSGLAELVEKFYLSETLSEKISECDIIVNPIDLKYLFGKTIIINRPGLDEAYLSRLAPKNTLIYRIKEPVMHGDFHPYLDKYIPEIIWSGFSVPTVSEDTALSLCEYSETYVSFPKVVSPESVYDSEGNLTYLGFILYQVGSLQYPGGSVFSDLDIPKTGKYFF